MDNVEKMMSLFPQLEYKLEPLMPDGQKGLINDKIVYLNPRQSKAELTSTLSEELGHYLTSSGNIIDQDTVEKRKQEKKARDVGATLVVSPDDIVKCFENDYMTPEACADFLGITLETFDNAVNYYRRKDGAYLSKKGDIVLFNTNGTISVFKRDEV